MKGDLEVFQLAIVAKEDFAILFHLVYHLENYDLRCVIYSSFSLMHFEEHTFFILFINDHLIPFFVK